jgi:hypothetical protein
MALRNLAYPGRTVAHYAPIARYDKVPSPVDLDSFRIGEDKADIIRVTARVDHEIVANPGLIGMVDKVDILIDTAV